MTGRHSSSRTAWVGVVCLAVCLALPVGGQSQRRIAYASQRVRNTDVRIMKASGDDDRRVTTHPTEDRHPTWSPDGRQIAFTSDRDSVSRVYVVNLDGTGLRRLTDDPVRALGPDRRPRGSRVFYSVWDEGFPGQVFTVDAETGRVRKVTGTPIQWESDPEWSPDGEFIATSWWEFPNVRIVSPSDIAIIRDDGEHVA